MLAAITFPPWLAWSTNVAPVVWFAFELLLRGRAMSGLAASRTELRALDAIATAEVPPSAAAAEPSSCGRTRRLGGGQVKTPGGRSNR